ncbi:RteC domain-containing protein [Mucilaginibacter sp. Mucisp86]|uniref:RteC domain-containing protein n=1 Tax=Mucilaginibacter sp. Mucisp86 TaxID=3243060 RepID=UPI0039B5BAEE
MEIVLRMLAELNQQIEQIELSSEDILSTAKSAYTIIELALLNLKNYISTYRFINIEEEVYFFKELKPKFYSKLIFYIQVFHIETHRPTGSEKVLRKYLRNRLDTITQFSHDNREFYKYVRSGATYLDQLYFVRNKHDIAIGFDTAYFDCDPSFCTSHDYKMSMLLANEQLADYLNAELKKLTTKNELVWIDETGLGWSETKVALIELLYGLQSMGVFYNRKSNTKADVKQVASFFEQLFEIDLGNYYRTFQEIRIRKTRTSFLDKMREKLIERMDDSDEIYR